MTKRRKIEIDAAIMELTNDGEESYLKMLKENSERDFFGVNFKIRPEYFAQLMAISRWFQERPEAIVESMILDTYHELKENGEI